MASLIPASWRPYAKAVIPALLTVVGLIVHALVTGEVDRVELEVGTIGLAAAFLTFLVPNAPLGAGAKAYLKALVPFLVTIVGVALHGVFTGEWNRIELAAAVTGVAASLVTFLVPNAPEDSLRPADPLHPAFEGLAPLGSAVDVGNEDAVRKHEDE